MYQILYYDPSSKRIDVEEYSSADNFENFQLPKELSERIQELRDAGAPTVRVQYIPSQAIEIVRH